MSKLDNAIYIYLHKIYVAVYILLHLIFYFTDKGHPNSLLERIQVATNAYKLMRCIDTIIPIFHSKKDMIHSGNTIIFSEHQQAVSNISLALGTLRHHSIGTVPNYVLPVVF